MGVNLSTSRACEIRIVDSDQTIESEMAWLREWLCVLLLVVAAAQAQDPPADDGDATAAGDAAGDDAATRDAEGEGDEEAWQYVEFLKTEVNEKVELILQETLYEAREKKGLTVLEETVSKTMEQVIESGAGPDDAPEVECMPPAMYAMELIGVNEMIDEEIKNLYNRIVTTTEEDERQKLFKKLEDFKSLRDTVDDMITKLMSTSEDDKIKKLVKRSLGRVISQVRTILKDCLTGCGPDVECESCAADVLSVAIVKMNYYKQSFNNTDDDEAKKEFVRSDLIKYINDNSNDAREILIKKATDGEIDECDQEKSHIYNKIKGPMWMLVNTTTFSDVSELEVMVDAMVIQLQTLLEEYCDPTTWDP